MPSKIDPSRPADSVPAVKAELRENLLAAATELNHGGFFVAAAAAAERLTRDKLREAGVSILDFGADPTGVADSREAIQRALDEVGSSGGGTVTMPPGTFKVVCPSLAEAALTIDHDNVTLQGAGMFATRLFFRVAGDLDPATNWELKNGGTAVHRGDGFYITPHADPNQPKKNVVLRDFEYDGGAGNTGNIAFPADTGTGDGWDLTHKGLRLPENAAGEDILVERVWFHTWRGEVTYRGGGAELKRVTVRDCRFGDTNANGLNISGMDVHYIHNDVYGCANDAAELLPAGDGTSLIAHNSVTSCKHGFVVPGRIETDGSGRLIISDNQLTDIIGGAAIRISTGNTIVANNTIVDYDAEGILFIQPQLPSWVQDRKSVLIQGNTLETRTRGSIAGAIILLGHADSPMENVVVENNVISVIDPVVADQDYAFVHYLTADCSNVVFRGNHVFGTLRLLRMNGAWPGGLVKMPLFLDNELKARGLGANDQVQVITTGVDSTPLGGPIVQCWTSTEGAFHEPAITASHYPDGYRVTIIAPGSNEPTYIPRRSASFRCVTDRYLYAGCEIDLEFDTALGVFLEVGWRDGRSAADTTQSSGTTLDPLGRTSVVLSYASPATITAHQAIPEGVPIVIRATNGNATLANNAAIATVGGSNLTLEADRPYLFVRVGGVLRQAG